MGDGWDNNFWGFLYVAVGVWSLVISSTVQYIASDAGKPRVTKGDMKSKRGSGWENPV